MVDEPLLRIGVISFHPCQVGHEAIAVETLLQNPAIVVQLSFSFAI
jgi:hypothetical protein